MIHVTFVSNMTFMHVCILAAEVLNLKIKALDFTANRKEVLFFNWYQMYFKDVGFYKRG